jgi:hypothetical protein
MYKKIIFLLLSLFSLSVSAEGFNLGLNPSTWQPHFFEYELTSTFKIDKVVYLKQTVPAPFEGILLYKADLEDIKTEMNRISNNETDCIDEQRLICDKLIDTINDDCLSYNDQLIKDKKELIKKLNLKTSQYKKLQFKTTVALVISGVIVTALTTSLVYGTL